MRKTREEVLNEVIDLMQELAADWDYSRPLTPETGLFFDLGFESLSVVVLGTAIQERYQRETPFAALLADVGQREVRDLTIGELVDFVCRHLDLQSVETEAR